MGCGAQFALPYGAGWNVVSASLSKPLILMVAGRSAEASGLGIIESGLEQESEFEVSIVRVGRERSIPVVLIFANIPCDRPSHV